MKLSELDPLKVKVVQAAPESAEPLRLSSLDPSAVTVVQAERGKNVYNQAAGPEQDSFIGRVSERIQDPQRWKAILTGKGPAAMDVVQGDAPLVTPGGALPKLTKAATALAEGKGLGFAAARTALSTGQGAVMSAASGPENETLGEKIDRAKAGAKLSAAIQAGAEALPVVGKVAGYAFRKGGQALTGVSDDIIKTYSDKTDEVNDLIKSSGGDMTEAADQVRTELSAGIQSTKNALNKQISNTLKNAPQERNISVQPILDQLEAAKAKLNPNFKASAIAEIDEMIANIKANSPDGMTNVQGLYETKQYLNEGAKSAYNKGGQIFTRAGESARAAKEASRHTREMLRPAAKDISEADRQLSSLHAIESRLNKNLLKAGAPDSALFAAGSGGNKRNEAMLKILGENAGVDAVGKAKTLAAARAFSNPSVLPTDTTGKAVGRMLVGSGVGGAIAGPMGAAVGGALASPMTLKAGINAVNVAKQVGSRFPNVAQSVRQNPVTATAVTQLTKERIRQANDPNLNPMAQPPVLGEGQQNRKPAEKPALKGEAKWLDDGARKLGLSESERAELMKSKRGRDVLLRAHGLKDGSAVLKQIKEQIRQQKGQGR